MDWERWITVAAVLALAFMDRYLRVRDSKVADRAVEQRLKAKGDQIAGVERENKGLLAEVDRLKTDLAEERRLHQADVQRVQQAFDSYKEYVQRTVPFRNVVSK